MTLLISYVSDSYRRLVIICKRWFEWIESNYIPYRDFKSKKAQNRIKTEDIFQLSKRLEAIHLSHSYFLICALRNCQLTPLLFVQKCACIQSHDKTGANVIQTIMYFIARFYWTTSTVPPTLSLYRPVLITLYKRRTNL